jgi:hypothetical protein
MAAMLSPRFFKRMQQRPCLLQIPMTQQPDPRQPTPQHHLIGPKRPWHFIRHRLDKWLQHPRHIAASAFGEEATGHRYGLRVFHVMSCQPSVVSRQLFTGH